MEGSPRRQKTGIQDILDHLSLIISIRWMGLRNVALVEDGGKHPWIFVLVNIPSRDAGDAGFRWPIHSMSMSNLLLQL